MVSGEFRGGRGVEGLGAGFDGDYRPKLVDDPAALEEALRFADAWIVRNRTQVRGRLLEAAANVRVIGRLGVGLDNIDLVACEARGIKVIPPSGANPESLAQYAVTPPPRPLRGPHFSPPPPA